MRAPDRVDLSQLLEQLPSFRSTSGAGLRFGQEIREILLILLLVLLLMLFAVERYLAMATKADKAQARSRNQTRNSVETL